jgi:hypothetical protein
MDMEKSPASGRRFRRLHPSRIGLGGSFGEALQRLGCPPHDTVPAQCTRQRCLRHDQEGIPCRLPLGRLESIVGQGRHPDRRHHQAKNMGKDARTVAVPSVTTATKKEPIIERELWTMFIT